MPFGIAPLPSHRQKGQIAYQDGLAAEEAVERHYIGNGCELLNRRWRGRCGEIDLIFRDGPELVFVEVKKARTHETAILRLSERQLVRVARSAEDYVCRVLKEPFALTRLDLATVDQTGDVATTPNLTLY